MVMFAANQSVLGDHERKDTVKCRRDRVVCMEHGHV